MDHLIFLIKFKYLPLFTNDFDLHLVFRTLAVLDHSNFILSSYFIWVTMPKNEEFFFQNSKICLMKQLI